MKNQRYFHFIIALMAFIQISILWSYKQKAIVNKPAPTITVKSKKVAMCCKSGIPSRFVIPKPGIATPNK
ncbi:MAG: hypothetical protein JWN56_1989 [Sphingobacteriales bacterium]|nr:hypothetical protein [Sphingobacteriales bacterium]